jgi:hypothetical protein
MRVRFPPPAPLDDQVLSLTIAQHGHGRVRYPPFGLTVDGFWFWHPSDLPTARQCLLIGLKQTRRGHAATSESDPSATSARLSCCAKPSFSPIEVLVWADAIPRLGDREAPSITRSLELLLLNSSIRNEGVLE